MYEVKRCKRKVNGVMVETWKAEMISANILEIEVGTTGYRGGDTGHGGRTYLRLKDVCSTDMAVDVFEDEFIVELDGDTELQTLIEALEFALKVLKDGTRHPTTYIE